MSILDVRGPRVTALGDDVGTRARVAGVNLLPPEILAGRALRRTQTLLAAGALVVVAAVGGVYVTARADASTAAGELAVVQATGSTLRADQARYAQVPRVAKAIDDAKAARATAMAQDVDWSRYLTSFSLTLPQGVWFTSLGVTVAATPAASSAATPAAGGAASAGATAASTLATVSINGVATSVPSVAAFLDSLSTQPAVTDPFVSSAVKAPLGSRQVVNFVSTGNVGAGALSHRFDVKAGS